MSSDSQEATTLQAAAPKADAENGTISAEIDVVAKEWVEEQVKVEIERLRKANAIVTPLNILNCGVIPNFERRMPRAINRIELDTTDDPKKIKEVMVSPEINYPHKQKFYYVNLILMTKDKPLLAPYVFQNPVEAIRPEETRENRKYPAKKVFIKNTLKEFLFINKNGERARLSIAEFDDI